MYMHTHIVHHIMLYALNQLIVIVAKFREKAKYLSKFELCLYEFSCASYR